MASMRCPMAASRPAGVKATDVGHLMEMIEITQHTLGAADIDENPDTFIADAGYFWVL